MLEFFFYNNLKNEMYINKINTNYTSQKGHVFINNYENLNELSIHDKSDNNKIKLDGLYVCFNDNISLDEILKKINEMNIGTKSKYHIKQTMCYLENNIEKYVYVIL